MQSVQCLLTLQSISLQDRHFLKASELIAVTWVVIDSLKNGQIYKFTVLPPSEGKNVTRNIVVQYSLASKGDSTINLSLVSSLGHICVPFSGASSFDIVAVASSVGHR